MKNILRKIVVLDRKFYQAELKNKNCRRELCRQLNRVFPAEYIIPVLPQRVTKEWFTTTFCSGK